MHASPPFRKRVGQDQSTVNWTQCTPGAPANQTRKDHPLRRMQALRARQRVDRGRRTRNQTSWAFDRGLFTVADTHQMRVSGAVRRAERQRFDLEEYDGEGIVPLHSMACQPDSAALEWHRQSVFLAG